MTGYRITIIAVDLHDDFPDIEDVWNWVVRHGLEDSGLQFDMVVPSEEMSTMETLDWLRMNKS